MFIKRLFIAMFLLVFVGGCASKKPQLYMLSPSVQARHKVHKNTADVRYVGLEKVVLPQYLQTENITFRINNTKIHQDDFHKWAEPLADNISRVIAVTAHNMFRNVEVVADPWPFGTPINTRLRVTILRFDSDMNCISHLTATWAIYEKDEDKLLYKHTKRYHHRNESSEINDIVKSMNKNVNDLSRDIAWSLSKVNR